MQVQGTKLTLACDYLMKKPNATKARLVSSSKKKLRPRLFCHTKSKWKAYAVARVSRVDSSTCRPGKQGLVSEGSRKTVTHMLMKNKHTAEIPLMQSRCCHLLSPAGGHVVSNSTEDKAD